MSYFFNIAYVLFIYIMFGRFDTGRFGNQPSHSTMHSLGLKSGLEIIYDLPGLGGMLGKPRQQHPDSGGDQERQ